MYTFDANFKTMADRQPQHITVLAKNILPEKDDDEYYYFRVMVTPRTLGKHCNIQDEIRLGVPLSREIARFIHDFYETFNPEGNPDLYHIRYIRESYPQLYTPLMMSAEDAAINYYVTEAWINGELPIGDKMHKRMEADIREGSFLPDGDEHLHLDQMTESQREAQIKAYLEDDGVYEEWIDWNMDNLSDPEYLIENFGADEYVDVTADDFDCYIPNELTALAE